MGTEGLDAEVAWISDLKRSAFSMLFFLMNKFVMDLVPRSCKGDENNISVVAEDSLSTKGDCLNFAFHGHERDFSLGLASLLGVPSSSVGLEDSIT